MRGESGGTVELHCRLLAPEADWVRIVDACNEVILILKSCERIALFAIKMKWCLPEHAQKVRALLYNHGHRWSSMVCFQPHLYSPSWEMPIRPKFQNKDPLFTFPEPTEQLLTLNYKFSWGRITPNAWDNIPPHVHRWFYSKVPDPTSHLRRNFLYFSSITQPLTSGPSGPFTCTWNNWKVGRT